MSKDREALLRQLEKLAFYKSNDAIRLALEGGRADVGRLRLEGVAEFKCHGNGAVEIKFVDRLKALELLLKLREELPEAGDKGVWDFLQGLGGGEEA